MSSSSKYAATVPTNSNKPERRLLLLDFDGPVCPLHRNTTAGNPTFQALGGLYNVVRK